MTVPFQSVIQPADLFSKSLPEGRVARLFQFPLVRFIVIALFLLPVVALNALLVLQVIERFEEPVATYIDIIRMIITIPLLLLSYALYCRVFEKRQAVEISLSGAGKEWGAGFLLATILVVVFVAFISVFGHFEIVEYRPAGILLKNVLLFGMGSLLQDLILLLVLFRLVEEFAGTWIALVAGLLIFGLVHMGNPNQTLITTMLLILSSIILIAPFILTRRLWLSWGIHAGWNFMQAGVFGMANSGIMFSGWMVTKIEGPEWLTGGAIGLEGSYLSFGADVTIGLIILFAAIQVGQTVKPQWKRAIDSPTS